MENPVLQVLRAWVLSCDMCDTLRGVFLFCLYILDVFISWFWFVSYTYTWQKPLF